MTAQIGVYGGGRMGGGIAHAFLLAGAEVTVIESDDDAASAAHDRIESSIRVAQERGQSRGPAEHVMQRLRVEVEAGELAHCEFIIEALPEDISMKQDVLKKVQDLAPDSWLASNTSSLSIDALASALAAPERLVGLHFFNPVPASQLVEIVVGDRTDQRLVETSRSWVEKLDKTAIVVTDNPGFASSRLGVVLALEAMRMVEEGVASAADIDTAMTLGYKHPLGPLKTTDIVGLDVRLAIAEHLHAELGLRFEPPTILRRMVDEGALGRKSGQGFYSW